MALTPDEREDIFRDIWRDVITVFALPVVLFSDTFKQLQKALFRGFGANLDDFAEGSAEFVLLTKLKGNLNQFSAAKTFQNIKDTQVFRLDEGRLRPFTEFRKDARKIFDQYNENWLKTEFETTVASSQSADQWQDFERDKKALPLLKYQTIGDDRVRPEHAELDGIVRPVTDSFWDTFMPPNGFNCRCTVIQLEEGEEPISPIITPPPKPDPDIFNSNPGKDPFIFKSKGKSPHPYFKVPRDFDDLKKRNFDLPTE